MDEFYHDKLHEECGVFGVYSPREDDVAMKTYYGIFALQHRGQESCGIAVNNDGVITGHKDVGIVNDVYSPRFSAGVTAWALSASSSRPPSSSPSILTVYLSVT